MGKHSEGPWYAAKSAGRGQGLIISEKTGKNIAVAYDEIDAPVLAAAPDLLEACEKIIEDWEHNLTEAMRLVHAAVDKAKGGA